MSRKIICMNLNSPLAKGLRAESSDGSADNSVLTSSPTMAWMLLILAILSSSFMGTFSEVVLTQPESVAGSPGGTIRIPCSISSGTFSGRDSSWYQQKPGNAPKLLIYQDSNRADGIPERFSGSLENSETSAVLTISNLQAEDEAGYHCLYYIGGDKYIFGGGTQVTVTGLPPVTPSVQLFAPTPEETRGSNPYTAVCLISDFRPPALEVQWKGNNVPIRSGVETTKASKQGDKYLASSYLKLSEADYAKYDSFSCEVTHQGNTIVKTVTKSGSC